MIKVVFGNPIIFIEGKTTKMKMCAQLKFNGAVGYTKIFKSTIKLKDNDKYDLQKAKTILQTLCEAKAYVWARDKATKMRNEERKILNDLDNFIEKSSHIIHHYIEFLKPL